MDYEEVVPRRNNGRRVFGSPGQWLRGTHSATPSAGLHGLPGAGGRASGAPISPNRGGGSLAGAGLRLGAGLLVLARPLGLGPGRLVHRAASACDLGSGPLGAPRIWVCLDCWPLALNQFSGRFRGKSVLAISAYSRSLSQSAGSERSSVW